MVYILQLLVSRCGFWNHCEHSSLSVPTWLLVLLSSRVSTVGRARLHFSLREEQRWNPGLPSGPWVLRSDEISSPTWVQPLPGRAVRWRSTCCLLPNAHGACVNLPRGLGTERCESGAPPTFLFSNHESCWDILPQTKAPSDPQLTSDFLQLPTSPNRLSLRHTASSGSMQWLCI